MLHYLEPTLKRLKELKETLDLNDPLYGRKLEAWQAQFKRVLNATNPNIEVA